MEKRAQISIADISTVSISGKDNEQIVAGYTRVEKLIQKHQGKIIRYIVDKDGIALEILFHNLDAKKILRQALSRTKKTV